MDHSSVVSGGIVRLVRARLYYSRLMSRPFEFFFFKQKTAYEISVRDWSSDVWLFRSRRVHRGDLLIIASFTWLDEAEAQCHAPEVVLVDTENRIRKKNGVAIEAA